MQNIKNLKILFPDRFHFHERNFRSLFTLIKRYKIYHTFVDSPNDWLNIFGDYAQKSSELRSYYLHLSTLSKDQLINSCHHGVNLFDTARAEFLSYVLPKPTWRNYPVPGDRKLLYNRAIERDYDALLLNMAAACYWIDFWKNKLAELPVHTHCCVFSGSQIYTRSLLEILKTHMTQPMVMESFFTGNDYYCEAKYEPIANNSDLGHPAYYNSMSLADNSKEVDRSRIKVINKILLAKNKNVKQPKEKTSFHFINKAPTATIIGQVINDFSIIETYAENINSLDIYKRLIRGLLNHTQFNIVFKAHPWERYKPNLKYPLTWEVFEQFTEQLKPEHRERFLLIEDFNIVSLFEQTDFLITICSQAAIEGAFHGLKPILIGHAFYGKKGFTHDYENVEVLISHFSSGSLKGVLTLNEFDAFEVFLLKSLGSHLVSIYDSGVSVLSNRFDLPPLVPLVRPISHDPIPPEKSKITDTKGESTLNNVKLVPLRSSETQSQKRQGRKWRKLWRNPQAFFKDSRNPILRSFSDLVARG